MKRIKKSRIKSCKNVKTPQDYIKALVPSFFYSKIEQCVLVFYKVEEWVKPKKLVLTLSQFLSIYFFTSVLISIQRVKLFYSAGWPDPFYYLGYAIDIDSLQVRNGPTYSASRIPAIILIKMRNELHISNQAFRIGLLTAITHFIVLTLQKHFSINRTKAILVSIIATNNLMLFRHISDDYAQYFANLFAFPILYLAISVLSKASQKGTDQLKLGLLLASAVLCNLSVVIIWAPFILGIIGLSRIRKSISWNDTLRFIWNLICGLFLGICFYIFISVIIAGQKSIQNFVSLIHTSIEIQGEQNSMWTKPLSSISSYVILFVLVLILSIREIINSTEASKMSGPLQGLKLRSTEVVETNSTSTSKQFALIAIGTISFGIFWHQIFGGAWLSYSFYAALYLPLVILAVALSLRNTHWLLLLLILLLQVIVMRFFTQIFSLGFFDHLSNVRQLTLLLTLLCLIALITRFRDNAAFHWVVAVVVLIAPINESWNSYNVNSREPLQGEYIDFVKSWENNFQADVQTIAQEFAVKIKKEATNGQSVWTVYPSNATWITSVVSTQQYGYSCFHCADAAPLIESVADLENIGEYYEELRQRDFTYLLSTSPLNLTPNKLFSPSSGLAFETEEMLGSKELQLFVYKFRRH